MELGHTCATLAFRKQAELLQKTRNISTIDIDGPKGSFKPWYVLSNTTMLNESYSPVAFGDSELERFITMIELYIMPVISAMCIVMNVIAMSLLNKDLSMRRTTHILLEWVMVSDNFFLIISVVFTQLRHYWRNPEPLDLYLEVMTYLTLTLNFMHFLSIWLLYVASVDACRHLMSFQFPQRLFKPKIGFVVFFLSVIIHLPFLPPLRRLMGETHSVHHDPCVLPLENQWDLVIDDVPKSDLFYILYFVFAYWMLTYSIPYFLLGCCCKDLLDFVDSNHHLGNMPRGWPVEALFAGRTACIMATVMATTMLLLTPKLLLLLFKMMEFAAHYLHNAHLHFQYFNAVANALVLIRCGLCLPVLLWFSASTRMFFYRKMCECRSHRVSVKHMTIIKVDELSEDMV